MPQVKFISQTLADYREVRKIYHYDYSPEDLTALKHCATDLRPFTWSALPAGVTWWLSGRFIPTAGCGREMDMCSMRGLPGSNLALTNCHHASLPLGAPGHLQSL